MTMLLRPFNCIAAVSLSGGAGSGLEAWHRRRDSAARGGLRTSD